MRSDGARGAEADAAMLLAEAAESGRRATGRLIVLDRTPETLTNRRSSRRAPRRRRPAARGQAARRLRGLSRAAWQFFVASELLEPDPAHRLSQRRRPGRAGHRHSLSLAVPRRPDRRARPEPAGAGRDHRRRDRGLGHGRDRRHHHRSASGCSNCSPARRYGPSDERLSGLEFPINPERVAPVLRRLISPTNTRARIYDRDGVLMLDSRNLYVTTCCASTCRRRNGRSRTSSSAAVCRCARWLDARRPAALSRARAEQRQGLRGSRERAHRAQVEHGARSTSAAR